MSRSVYDTRFLIEYFYSQDKELLERVLQEIRRTKERIISAITIHELHLLTLKKEGREVANIRKEAVKSEFKTIPVDYETAVQAAVFRQKYGIPMGDSLIAATSYVMRAPCVTDDQHFLKIREIKTRWLK